MSNFNDRIEINTSTSFGFCNNLDLSVSVFTQPNLSLRYLDNHLLPGIYFYNMSSVYLFERHYIENNYTEEKNSHTDLPCAVTHCWISSDISCWH